MLRAFRQVDVFTPTPYRGNPLAVVLDAEGLDDETMQRFANWMNLSETTFVLAPTLAGADYRVRIFTPDTELPFAGHPTLGTCHAWLEHTSTQAQHGNRFVQQCAAGFVDILRTDAGLAFAAPPLRRSGLVEDALRVHVADMLGVRRESIADAQWVDNGPGWVAVMLEDASAVLELKPGLVDMPIGVVGLYRDGDPFAYEVRAFLPMKGSTLEDPVTGSLNASVAQWLTRQGRVHAPYVVSQGTMLGRAGRRRRHGSPDTPNRDEPSHLTTPSPADPHAG